MCFDNPIDVTPILYMRKPRLTVRICQKSYYEVTRCTGLVREFLSVFCPNVVLCHSIDAVRVISTVLKSLSSKK